ncbi:RagB/SusD family nutrient uptake outer membrane protein [Pedobacter sp. MC2016-24]|uniref:RagB/SusD family nutrient uptake outer membrane protein n=1 Tax=Pedobacter sp. MC2016-24 TaxID=2780090 RepID=UPI0018808911|nr:RagB/SusD family nutrient uptake outer membrane protein [Pedobacter sp. MC2016-24]MBE9598262.1 RagB/SusD family nutrient uptake outer membrane protein [Pedobacter sp. MC2016-24]
MQSKKLWPLVFVLLLASSSCKKYLDVVPDNVPTIDNAFTSKNEAEKFLFTCYSYLPADGSPTSNPGFLAGDEMWIPASRRGTFDTGSAPMMWDIALGRQNSANPIYSLWSSRYQAIRQCNIFLENVQDENKVFDLTSDMRSRWLSEVKTLKAFYNFQLLRMYGPIPIVDTNIDIDAPTSEMMVSRAPFDECVNYIVKLLDEATPALPLVISDRTTELGRMTQPIALAIKAKLLVLAASPLFNGNADYNRLVNRDGTPLVNTAFDKTKWDRAAVASKAAIDACDQAGIKLYTAVPLGVLSAFTNQQMTLRNVISERWNTERVWGLSNSTAGQLQRVAMGCLTSSFTPNNSNAQLAAPMKIADLFYTKNGVPMNEDRLLDFTVKNELRTATADERFAISQFYQTARVNFDREPRFYADLGFDGGVWYMVANNPASPLGSDEGTFYMQAKFTQPGNSGAEGYYNETGYFIKKLVEANLTNSSNSNTVKPYDWPEIRLADLYLLYAEALNESKGPTDPDIFKYLDLIRLRAGLEGVRDSWTKYTKDFGARLGDVDYVRNIIRRERGIELAFEGSRFWDLRRWKTAASELNAPITGWTISQSSAVGYYQTRVIYNQTFIAPRDYLWPIQTGAFRVNTNLVQNPGW